MFTTSICQAPSHNIMEWEPNGSSRVGIRSSRSLRHQSFTILINFACSACIHRSADGFLLQFAASSTALLSVWRARPRGRYLHRTASLAWTKVRMAPFVAVGDFHYRLAKVMPWATSLSPASNRAWQGSPSEGRRSVLEIQADSKCKDGAAASSATSSSLPSLVQTHNSRRIRHEPIVLAFTCQATRAASLSAKEPSAPLATATSGPPLGNTRNFNLAAERQNPAASAPLATGVNVAREWSCLANSTERCTPSWPRKHGCHDTSAVQVSMARVRHACLKPARKIEEWPSEFP